MWKVKFDKRTEKEFQKLDPDIQKRILKWLSKRIETKSNPRRFGKALKGRMKGLWRYRVGAYRVVCQIQNKNKIILVLRVAHIRDIYE